LHPLLIWKDQIIDGHTRYRISKELDVEFKVEPIEFENENQAILWILNNQLGRRNLNDFQRIEIAKKKNEYQKAGRPKKNSGNNAKINTRDKIAKDAGVSSRKVGQYEYLEKKAEDDPDAAKVLGEIKSGNKKIGTGYRETKEKEGEKEVRKEKQIRVPLIKCELVFKKGEEPKEVPSSDKKAKIILNNKTYNCEFICTHNTSKFIKENK